MSDAICACLGQPLFVNRLILGLNLDKLDSHPFDGAYEVMAGCATLFDLCGASDTKRGFLCWVSSVHAIVGHVHFTSGVERLFASGFKRGALRGSCCSDPRVHTITKQSRGTP